MRPELMHVRLIGGIAEILAMRQLVSQDRAACRGGNRLVGSDSRDRNQTAVHVRAEPSELRQQPVQFLLLRVELYILLRREGEKMRHRIGTVVVSIVERLDSIAASNDRRVEFRVVQDPVVRHAALFGHRRDPIQHQPLLTQRGEVQHDDRRVRCETEYRQSGRDVSADLCLVGGFDHERRRGLHRRGGQGGLEHRLTGCWHDSNLRSGDLSRRHLGGRYLSGR
jgi:hypothetical protein